MKATDPEVQTILRLIIVDDNADTLAGLRQLIEWRQLGIQLVGTARNGREGLALLSHESVDIVIADIRMPDIDGLELTARVRREYPNTRVVLMSAHEEFEYAREALRLGVEEYLLKPLGVDQIQQTLKVVSEKVRADRRFAILQKRREADLADRRQLVFDRLLTDIVTAASPLDARDVAERLVANGIDFSSRTVVGIVLASDEPWDCTRSLDQEVVETLNLAMRDRAATDERIDVVRLFNPHENRVSGLVGFPAQHSRRPGVEFSTLSEIGRSLREQAQVETGCGVSVGLGDCHFALADIRASVAEAEHALYHRLYRGGAQCFDFARLNGDGNATFQFPLQMQRDLVDALRAGSQNSAERIVNALAGKMRADAPRAPRAVRHAYEDLLITVAKIGAELSDGAVAGEDPLGRAHVHSLTFLEHFERELRWLVDNTGLQVKRIREGAGNRARIEISRQFVVDHLGDDMSLSRVAAHVGLSPNYYSSLFREIVGVTFHEFLVSARVSRAKSLLRHGTFRVYEVAAEVGYRDTRYFSQIFKREVGMTPSEYARSAVDQ